MVGRRFTWYKSNESIESITDSVLVSWEWLEEWSNSK